MRTTGYTIADAMTKAPHGIAPGESAAAARERMRTLGIHHLPVRTGGKVIGIISERDLDLLASFRDVDPKKTRVDSIMITDPYMVSPRTPLVTVAEEMAKRRIGSVLVVDDQDNLLGIFTDTDSLRWIGLLLKKHPARAKPVKNTLPKIRAIG